MDTPDILFQYLKDILYRTESAELDLEQLPPEFRKLGQGMQLMGEWMKEAKELSLSLAKGDLTYDKVDRENVLAAPIKELQSTLRHMAWQTQQVTKGDYSQTVDFMGDFSVIFNAMTRQLREKREKEYSMYQLAYADPLTGLYNQRYAMEKMQEWINQKIPFVLSYIDVDYLKYYNDTCGHRFGDAYLLKISEALGKLGGVLCRTGGDEFMVLDSGKTAGEQNRALEKIRKGLQESGTETGCPQSFSYASCEIPVNPEKSLEEYIALADAKMYQYKAQWRTPPKDRSYKDNRVGSC